MLTMIRQLADKLCDHPIFLGAQRCSEEIGDPVLKSKTKTYTAYLENFFGFYFEQQEDPKKYRDIDDSYKTLYTRFTKTIQHNIQNKSPMHAICQVAYIRFGFVAQGSRFSFTAQKDKKMMLVVEDLTIRPCAIGHGFVEDILVNIARGIQSSSAIEQEFQLKIKDAKHILIDAAIKSTALPEIDKKTSRFGIPGAIVSPTWYTYTFKSDAILNLKEKSIFSTATCPNPTDLNDFTKSKEKNTLIERMVTDPRAATFWDTVNRYTDDDTNSLSSLIQIPRGEIESLRVFTGRTLEPDEYTELERKAFLRNNPNAPKW